MHCTEDSVVVPSDFYRYFSVSFFIYNLLLCDFYILFIFSLVFAEHVRDSYKLESGWQCLEFAALLINQILRWHFHMLHRT